MKKFLFTMLLTITSLFGFEHLNPENMDEKLKNKNAIVDFYATWCPPCKVLAKNLIEFDKVKSDDVVIYKVDIDQYRELATKYNVRSLPTLVYIKNGKVIEKKVGIQDLASLKNSSDKYLK